MLVARAIALTVFVVGPVTYLGACRTFGTLPAPEDGGAPSSDSGLPEAGGDAAWCATHGSPEAFCADFDTVQTVDEGWTTTRYEKTDAGAITLSTEHPASGPRSARLDLGTEAAECRYVELVYRTAHPTTRGRLDFDVWLESPTATILARFGSANHCAIVVAGGDSHDVAVELDPKGTPGGTMNFDSPINRGEWTHLTIDVDFGARSFHVSHDAGTPVGRTDLDAGCNVNDFFQANIGIHCQGGQVNTEVFVDNVVITPR